MPLLRLPSFGQNGIWISPFTKGRKMTLLTWLVLFIYFPKLHSVQLMGFENHQIQQWWLLPIQPKVRKGKGMKKYILESLLKRWKEEEENIPLSGKMSVLITLNSSVVSLLQGKIFFVSFWGFVKKFFKKHIDWQLFQLSCTAWLCFGTFKQV